MLHFGQTIITGLVHFAQAKELFSNKKCCKIIKKIIQSINQEAVVAHECVGFSVCGTDLCARSRAKYGCKLNL